MGDWTQQDREDQANYWEPRAEYLIDNGWLDVGFIGVDEPRSHSGDKEALRLLIETFRTRPHAQYLKWFAYVYHHDIWDEFRTYLDIICQSNGDRAPGGISPTASAIMPEGAEHWMYWTDNTHAWIDVTGISHRLWVPKHKVFGVEGFAVWGIMQWWDEGTSDYCDNPWIDPRTNWGNGALAFFYPPSPLGTGLPAKDMSITPSLRLVLTRDGIEDYEYATILEQLIQTAETVGLNTAEAVKALTMMKRPLRSPVSWGLSEAYWEKARVAAAQAIENLIVPQITEISHDQSGGTISISWTALPDKTYQLYYADSLSGTTQWNPVSMSYTTIDGIATQDISDDGADRRFYKLEVN